MFAFVGKRYRPGGSSRGGYSGGGGGYSNGRSGGSGRFDAKPRSGAYSAQSDNINAMFAQAYQQVAATASGGTTTGNSSAAPAGSYTGYQYQ